MGGAGGAGPIGAMIELIEFGGFLDIWPEQKLREPLIEVEARQKLITVSTSHKCQENQTLAPVAIVYRLTTNYTFHRRS